MVKTITIQPTHIYNAIKYTYFYWPQKPNGNKNHNIKQAGNEAQKTTQQRLKVKDWYNFQVILVHSINSKHTLI